MDKQMKSKVFMSCLIAVRSKSKCNAHELPQDVSEHKIF
jgi:hypothetical protein